MTANLFNSAGNLYWYRHDGRSDGTPNWTGRNEVGSGGWQNYTSTFGTGNFIYAIDPDGKLYWYRHDGQSDGTPRWTGRKIVGEGGWQKYVSVFASGKYIYAIAPDGKLYWYRHDGQEDGTEQWTGRQEVGQGWQIYSSVFASGDIIYGIDYYGNLYWYRHDGQASGTEIWTGRNEVNQGGWDEYVSVLAAGDILYARSDGKLYWYRHDGQSDGTNKWTGRNEVGSGGWLTYKYVFGTDTGILYGVGLDPMSWMTVIPSSRMLNRITMPGTHETMALYGADSQCQTLTLKQQLMNGIRVFDIRVRYFPVNGQVNFSIHHSDDYQHAFLDSKFAYTNDSNYFVLDDCLEFLKDHKQECIVLLIKQEKDAQDRHTFFDAFWRIVNNRDGYNRQPLDQLFYMGQTAPRLGDARGKIIFAFVDGDGGSSQQLSSPQMGLYWGNIDFKVDSTNPLPGQQPNLDVENHWRDGLEEKWGKVQPHLYNSFASAPSSVWYVTYLSASMAPLVGHYPDDYANYLLPKVETLLGQYLVNEPHRSYFGTVMMDYPRTSVTNLLISAALHHQ